MDLRNSCIQEFVLESQSVGDFFLLTVACSGVSLMEIESFGWSWIGVTERFERNLSVQPTYIRRYSPVLGPCEALCK